MADSNKIKVQYDSLVALHSDQTIVNSTPESILVDFSSGIVPDPLSGSPMIPVHTRIAMTHTSARRLMESLQKALNAEPKTAKATVQVKQG